jgi:hypothetical protein
MRAKLMTSSLQLRTKLAEVVDLAVVRDPHGAIFVRHRLVGERRQVDDAETGMR